MKVNRFIFWSYLLGSVFLYSSLIDSETLTITTYYPAPYGGYVRLLTTDVTVLARDGGAVGIGTASPGMKLDVSGYVRASGEVIGTLGSGYGQFRAIAGNYGVMLRNDSSDTYLLLTNSGNPYGGWNTLRPFYINNNSGDVHLGADAIYVRHGGNVGVGTTSPLSRLHVNGDLRVNGNIYGVCRLVYYGTGGGTGCNWNEAVMGYFGDGNRRYVGVMMRYGCSNAANPACWQPFADGYEWAGWMYCCRITP